MSKKCDVSVIGADMRQIYMINELYHRGYTIFTYGINDDLITNKIKKTASLSEAISKSNILICPIPFTKNDKDIAFLDLDGDNSIKHFAECLNSNHIIFSGLIPEYLSNYCIQNKIEQYDFMKMNEVTVLNAVATAEGTIAEAIKRSHINIHGSNCLVLGFGICAQALSRKLKALDANVCVAARNKDARALAVAYGCHSTAIDKMDDILGSFDFVFNTIPALVLTKDKLEKLSTYVTIIDIASAPGGIDYSSSQKLNLNASLCLGLPGIYSPKSSGEILANVIEDILVERSGEFEN